MVIYAALIRYSSKTAVGLFFPLAVLIYAALSTVVQYLPEYLLSILSGLHPEMFLCLTFGGVSILFSVLENIPTSSAQGSSFYIS